jgi:hypothetical protein
VCAIEPEGAGVEVVVAVADRASIVMEIHFVDQQKKKEALPCARVSKPWGIIRSGAWLPLVATLSVNLQ